MKFLQGDEALAAALISLWAIEDAKGQAIVRRAVETDPGRMRRIHDESWLLYSDERLSVIARAKTEKNNLTVMEVLASGDKGISYIDKMLTQMFYHAAPREIFEYDDNVTQPEMAGRILLRLLSERIMSPEQDVEWHNPILVEHQPIDNPEKRMAKALSVFLASYDGDISRELIGTAFMDRRSPVIRRATAHAAASFVGFQDVAEQIAALAHDEDRRVRELALEAFRPFVGRKEVAERVSLFTADPDPEIKIAALTMIMDSPRAEDFRRQLSLMVYDLVPEVAEKARSYFSREDIQARLEEVCEDAAEGRRVTSFELGILARSRTIDSVLRSDTFFRRLEALRLQHGSTSALYDTLRALGSWNDEIGDEIWSAVARAIKADFAPILERALVPALGKTRREAALETIFEVARRPVPEGAASLRAEVVQSAIPLIEAFPAHRQRAEGIVLDTNYDERSRKDLLWVIEKTSDNEYLFSVLTALFDGGRVGEFLARSATRTALRQADEYPEERARKVDFLRRIARDRQDQAGKLAVDGLISLGELVSVDEEGEETEATDSALEGKN